MLLFYCLKREFSLEKRKCRCSWLLATACKYACKHKGFILTNLLAENVQVNSLSNDCWYNFEKLKMSNMNILSKLWHCDTYSKQKPNCRKRRYRKAHAPQKFCFSRHFLKTICLLVLDKVVLQHWIFYQYTLIRV